MRGTKSQSNTDWRSHAVTAWRRVDECREKVRAGRENCRKEAIARDQSQLVRDSSDEIYALVRCLTGCTVAGVRIHLKYKTHKA